MRADDDQLELAKAHEEFGPKAIEKLSVPKARQQPTAADAGFALLQQQGKSTRPEDLMTGVTRTTASVDGAPGPLTAKVYTPVGIGPFPVGLYFHGGGRVIADKDVYDAGARGLASSAHAIVVRGQQASARTQVPGRVGRRAGSR